MPTPTPPPLRLLYRDAHYVAVDKPAGMLVHRSWIASQETVFLLQTLRDQLGQRVYPIHRLDRPTSGVVLFALSSEAARALCDRFEQREVTKEYLAIVRGYTEEQGRIDYPLREEPHKPAQQAITDYVRLATVELPHPIGRYATARYSLLRVTPVTGRMRQIRKHCHHICHPLIGDTSHGEGRHNRLFREQFAVERLLLHAHRLRLRLPGVDQPVTITAPLPAEFSQLLSCFGWDGAAP
jgi:tRNA pseudouridine65 synthase